MAYKLLVVDDDQGVAEVQRDVLLKEGYQVTIASDGEEALRKVKEDNPDVILLDLMMPKLNGYEALKQIREKFTDKWRPVIIISARDELDSVKQCYGSEADHYLTKPCSKDDLLRAVRTMISLIPLRINKENPEA